MATKFTIYDDDNNEIDIDSLEASDNGFILPFYSMEMGSEKSSGGYIKQQIRPGLRYTKGYTLILTEARYIELVTLITNNSTNYYIEYATEPSILSNNSNIDQENNFKIGIELLPPTVTHGSDDGLTYRMELKIVSAELL